MKLENISPDKARAEFPYVNRPDVMETYVDHVWLCQYDPTAVRLELVVLRPSLQAPNRAFVTCSRLVLSINAAYALHQNLTEALRKLEVQHGEAVAISDAPPGSKQ